MRSGRIYVLAASEVDVQERFLGRPLVRALCPVPSTIAAFWWDRHLRRPHRVFFGAATREEGAGGER
jgi:hypothetical protein